MSAGPASVVFSRVVSSGHIKQAREDLLRRPDLVNMLLTGWGLAPLALAAHNGNWCCISSPSIHHQVSQPLGFTIIW